MTLILPSTRRKTTTLPYGSTTPSTTTPSTTTPLTMTPSTTILQPHAQRLPSLYPRSRLPSRLVTPKSKATAPAAPPMLENYRGTDGLWRFPNGDWHPRNISHIYGPDKRLHESSPQRGNYRGADGLWHYPDRHGHPRNIYATNRPADHSSPISGSPVE